MAPMAPNAPQECVAVRGASNPPLFGQANVNSIDLLANQLSALELPFLSIFR